MGEYIQSDVRTHRMFQLRPSCAPHRFKINDIAAMTDCDEGDKPEDFNLAELLGKRNTKPSVIERVPSSELAYSKPSMRGLQQVLAQGWLVQRAGDMCSFMHDRYRQAAIHMASQLLDITVMGMCLRVAFKLMQVRRWDPSLCHVMI
jgi:hypothetical protein